MKLTKSLFMLCAAGLSLCACNSDEKELFPEGTGTVEIRIVPPTVATRAVGSFTENSDAALTVTGIYTVTLDAVSGGGVIDDFDPKTADGGVAKFTGVVGPRSVTVSLNGGLKSSTTTLADLNPIAANSVPAYGETSTFTPDVANKKYTANVVMAIPVARLEVGEISFTNTDSKFTNLTVAGVYLDNLRTVGGSYVRNGNTANFTANENPVITDFYFAAGNPIKEYGVDNPNTGNAEIAYTSGGLGDAVSADLLTSSLSGVYTYNFYGATPGSVEPNATYSTAFDKNPHFKICFSETQLNNEGGTMPRYAMITKFKKDGKYIALENGKIYKVTAAQLTPQNIVDDEDGATVEYTVEVTVQEATWTIEEVTGEWQ